LPQTSGGHQCDRTARKLLSAVYRTGQAFGFGHVEKVLKGASDERVMQRGHDQLSVFGIVDDEEANLLRPVSRALQARGALVQNEHGGLMLGGEARAILKGEAEVDLIVPRPPKGPASPSRRIGGRRRQRPAVRRAARLAPRSCARGRRSALCHLPRRHFARNVGHAPMTLDGLAEISGVGARKRDAYGERFLDVIRNFEG
jgi:ATP-dependent DNA helicase RecQ